MNVKELLSLKGQPSPTPTIGPVHPSLSFSFYFSNFPFYLQSWALTESCF